MLSVTLLLPRFDRCRSPSPLSSAGTFACTPCRVLRARLLTGFNPRRDGLVFLMARLRSRLPASLYVAGPFAMGYTEFYNFLIPLYGLSLDMSASQIGMLVGARSLNEPACARGE
jgi:hypothetical protein